MVTAFLARNDLFSSRIVAMRALRSEMGTDRQLRTVSENVGAARLTHCRHSGGLLVAGILM